MSSPRSTSSGSHELSFNPQRLSIARERRGLTKADLAERCDVTRRAVSDWEAGKVLAPPVGRIARELNFPEVFFFGTGLGEVPEESVSFRALTSLSRRRARAALANASLVRAFSAWIDDNYMTPPVDVPDLRSTHPDAVCDPVLAARAVRELWGMGVRPILELPAQLESRGIRIFALNSADREVDAFSFWHGDQPFIFVNPEKSAERRRFDLAHELGHLILHREVSTGGRRDCEAEADGFATEFLMPARGLIAHASGAVRLQDVFTHKKHWRVSAMAMVRRLNHLGLLNDWQYRSMVVELNKRGFRNSEPGGMEPEHSVLLRKILTLAWEDGWSTTQLSKELGIPEDDLLGAVGSLMTDGSAWPGEPPSSRSGSHLSLVPR